MADNEPSVAISIKGRNLLTFKENFYPLRVATFRWQKILPLESDPSWSNSYIHSSVYIYFNWWWYKHGRSLSYILLVRQVKYEDLQVVTVKT